MELLKAVREARLEQQPMWGRAKIAVAVRREAQAVSKSIVGRVLAHLVRQGSVEPVPSTAQESSEGRPQPEGMCAPQVGRTQAREARSDARAIQKHCCRYCDATKAEHPPKARCTAMIIELRLLRMPKDWSTNRINSAEMNRKNQLQSLVSGKSAQKTGMREIKSSDW